MRGSRFTEAQIIGILQEADGGPTSEVCHGHRRRAAAVPVQGAPKRLRRSRCGGTVVRMNCWCPMYAFGNLMAIRHEGSRRPPGSRPADTI